MLLCEEAVESLCQVPVSMAVQRLPESGAEGIGKESLGLSLANWCCDGCVGDEMGCWGQTLPSKMLRFMRMPSKKHGRVQRSVGKGLFEE